MTKIASKKITIIYLIDGMCASPRKEIFDFAK